MIIHEERRNKLVNVLADVLTRLCERNDFLINTNTPLTRFHALQPPQITIEFYLKRIARYSNCSEECFVLALIYIDRLIGKDENFLVNSLNVHRLLITSIMLGAKFFDDQYFNNEYFGKIGGVSLKEINLLEIEFLFMINFNLFVETDMYETYNMKLLSQTKSSKNSGQMQGSLAVESNKKPNASRAAESLVKSVNRTEQPVRRSAVPSRLEAHCSNSRRVTRSRPKTPVCITPRMRQYPIQRCTRPSVNFLQTTKRIQMITP